MNERRLALYDTELCLMSGYETGFWRTLHWLCQIQETILNFTLIARLTPICTLILQVRQFTLKCTILLPNYRCQVKHLVFRTISSAQFERLAFERFLLSFKASPLYFSLLILLVYLHLFDLLEPFTDIIVQNRNLRLKATCDSTRRFQCFHRLFSLFFSQILSVQCPRHSYLMVVNNSPRDLLQLICIIVVSQI